MPPLLSRYKLTPLKISQHSTHSLVPTDYTRSTVVEAKQPPQRTGSTRIYKKTAARQSTGYSSQENMSESERAEKKKKWAKRELSDSDNVYSGKR